MILKSSSIVQQNSYTQILHINLAPADCLVLTFPTVLLTPKKTVNISVQNYPYKTKTV